MNYGKEFEKIFRANDVGCSLQEYSENELVERYEYNLDILTINTYKQINKILELIEQCLHIKVNQAPSQKYHFAIEVKKPAKELNLLDYIDNWQFDKLSAVIGIDFNGEPIIFDLKKAIHTLIGGSTGMGKTNIINNIIYNLTRKNSKQELQLYIIDIKKTLSMWNKLPHLIKRPISDPRDAYYTLQEIVEIMEQRHEILAKNKLSKAPDGMFPHIVVIIDELSDLMLSDLAKWIEKEIQHIAQLGRSVDISLILATQNPIRDVCTSHIKANCPSRIALKTMSSINSRVILDDTKPDASKLDGPGYAIIHCAGDTNNYTFKAFSLSDEQIQNYIKGEKQ